MNLERRCQYEAPQPWNYLLLVHIFGRSYLPIMRIAVNGLLIHRSNSVLEDQSVEGAIVEVSGLELQKCASAANVAKLNESDMED
jgi:hypothetical protein